MSKKAGVLIVVLTITNMVLCAMLFLSVSSMDNRIEETEAAMEDLEAVIEEIAEIT
ncbi:MAG: hypothetical protein AAF483_13825 [Planctomycetota bacterium]